MFTYELSKRISVDDIIIDVPNPGACTGTQFESTTERSALERAALYVALLAMGRPTCAGARQYVDTVTVKGAESHGSFTSEGNVRPFPPIMYEESGKRLQTIL